MNTFSYPKILDIVSVYKISNQELYFSDGEELSFSITGNDVVKVEAVVPFLTGELAVEDLAKKTGIELNTLNAILARLKESGLISFAQHKLLREENAFRYNNDLRANLFFEQILHRSETSDSLSLLSGYKVTVAGIGDVADELVQDLRHCGIQTFQESSVNALKDDTSNDIRSNGVDISSGYKHHEIIAYCQSDEAWEEAKEANEFCLSTNRVFIYARMLRDRAEVGPLVVPGQSACLECFISRRNAAASSKHELIDNIQLKQGINGYLQIHQSTVAHILAIEILKLFLSNTTPLTFNGVITVDYLSMLTTVHQVLRVPNCHKCQTS